MDNDHAKYEEAALIRSHYNRAISQVYQIYYDSEEIAAHLVLEVYRLENWTCESEKEKQDRRERLDEKVEILFRTKEAMHFILNRLQELARDRDRFVSDIYTSTKIADVESRLGDLTPWLMDLQMEVQGRAETAKLNAKISSEIARAKNDYSAG
jgi:hypothetical protein